jgi:hypothetical protein
MLPEDPKLSHHCNKTGLPQEMNAMPGQQNLHALGDQNRKKKYAAIVKQHYLAENGMGFASARN